MKKLSAVALAGVLLVAGACKSSSDGAKSTGSSSGSSASSSAPLSTVPGVGVTDTTVKVGIQYTDLHGLPGIKLDHGDYEAAFNAVIDDVNANGGAGGRQIVPVFAPVFPVGTDPAAAACTKLTEDEKVFAVIGEFPTVGPACYVTTHDTAVIGGAQSEADLAAAKAPWFPDGPVNKSLVPAAIKGFADSGVFNGKKVGVVVMAPEKSIMDDYAIPALKDNGVTPVDTAVIDTTNNDVAAAKAQIGVIAERFAGEGIDVVVPVGQAGFTFPQDIDDSSFRPRLAAVPQSGILAYSTAGATNADVLKDAITAGDAPVSVTWTAPGMQHCVDVVQKKTGKTIQDPRAETPDTPLDYIAVYAACNYVNLFKAIADKAGTVLNNETFLHAGESLGDYPTPTGLTYHFSADSLDGNPPVYLSHWDAAQKKFVAESKAIS